MNEQLKAVLKTIPLQNQRQDSTIDQLRDLREFAVRLGMYDACDLLTNHITTFERKQAAFETSLVLPKPRAAAEWTEPRLASRENY